MHQDDNISNTCNSNLRNLGGYIGGSGIGLVHKSLLMPGSDAYQKIVQLQHNLSLHSLLVSNTSDNSQQSNIDYCDPIQSLLDAISCDRSDINKSIFISLKEKLEDHITHMDKAQLLVMLNQSICLAPFEDLKGLPLAIIKRLSTIGTDLIPLQHLNYLAKKDLLKELPINVRRRAFIHNKDCFIQILQSFFNNSENPIDYYKLNEKTIIDQISDIIGSSEKLFDYFASYYSDLVYIQGVDSWSGLIMKVIINTNELGVKIKGLDKVTEFANLIGRYQRVGRIESIVDLTDSLKSIIILQCNEYEDIFKSKNNAISAMAKTQRILSERNPAIISTTKAAPSQPIKRKRDDSPTNKSVRIKTISTNDKTSKNSNSQMNKMSKDAWLKLLMELYKFMELNDEQRVFAMKVTDDIAPNYSQIILNPMSLDVIRDKIRNGKYDSLKKLDTDIKLMFANCRNYNGHGSFFANYAAKLNKKWKSKFEDIENYVDSLPISNASSDENTNNMVIISEPTASKSIKPYTITIPPKIENKSVEPQELSKTLQDLWKYLVSIDASNIFAVKVTDSIAPDYSKVIKHPMSLDVMNNKIRNSKYESLKRFENDVKLMFDNCKTYNEGFELEKYANDLEMKWKIEYERVCKQSSGSEIVITSKNKVDNNSLPPLVIKKQVQVKDKIKNVDISQNQSKENIGFLKSYPEALKLYVNIKDSKLFAKIANDKNERIKILARSCVNYCEIIDVNHYFLDPVTDDIAPSYSSIIKKPMCLRNIKSRIGKGYYINHGLQGLDDDMKLIISNCKLFNIPEDDVFK
eukprot:gene5773-7971_t